MTMQKVKLLTSQYERDKDIGNRISLIGAIIKECLSQLELNRKELLKKFWNSYEPTLFVMFWHIMKQAPII